ncbi:MAG: hypothetical protein L6Q57_03355 [Alphaproteobacteria bacterium]|nr:hypothetical protein [Alphaproteobacteria bacterium]
MRSFMLMAVLLCLTYPATAQSLKYKTYISPENQTPTETEEEQRAKIWEKYKALAAGRDPDQETPEEAEKDADMQGAADQAPESEQAAPRGLNAILDDVRQSKEKRGKLHTLTITKPKAPEVPEPAKPKQALSNHPAASD